LGGRATLDYHALSMKLTAYPTQDISHTPEIRPAESKRDWLDQLPSAYGYRCLPLTMANGHGWEILCPEGFEAEWNGRGGTDAIRISFDGIGGNHHFATSHFGSGILTFHTGYLFRSEPGRNLWVSGPPNMPKDGLQPLSGLIETDWSPYSFTMNWLFTRPGRPVRFEKDEAFCFFFPVDRDAVDGTETEIRDMAEDPDTAEAYEAWNASRRGFLDELPNKESAAYKERWQKGYYRGLMPGGEPTDVDHRTKVRACPFTGPAKKS
jgi:hypothetical protein